MSTTLKTNSVPKHDFTKSTKKGELNALYAGNGKYCRKVGAKIRAAMIAVTGDMHADSSDYLSTSQIRKYMQEYGLPKGYELADVPFMNESDL